MGNDWIYWVIGIAILIAVLYMFYRMSNATSKQDTEVRSVEPVAEPEVKAPEVAATETGASVFGMAETVEPVAPDVDVSEWVEPDLAVPGERLSEPGDPEAVAAEIMEAEPFSAEMIAPAPIEMASEDLTIIEGIGPKINAVLQRAGIRTFSDLAETTPERLQDILQESGMSLANPSSWPEQARYVVSGDMDGLRAIQDKLKGGRF